VEACKNRDMGMIDLLIKYSARDDDCKALGIALKAEDEIVASKLLTLKAHQVKFKKVKDYDLNLYRKIFF